MAIENPSVLSAQKISWVAGDEREALKANYCRHSAIQMNSSVPSYMWTECFSDDNYRRIPPEWVVEVAGELPHRGWVFRVWSECCYHHPARPLSCDQDWLTRLLQRRSPLMTQSESMAEPHVRGWQDLRHCDFRISGQGYMCPKNQKK